MVRDNEGARALRLYLEKARTRDVAQKAKVSRRTIDRVARADCLPGIALAAALSEIAAISMTDWLKVPSHVESAAKELGRKCPPIGSIPSEDAHDAA
jgi:hypothetical protein